MVPSIAKWMNTGAILVTMMVLGYFIAKSSAQPGALPRIVNPERLLQGIIPPPQKIAQTSVLTKDEVNQVAKQTTVLVANGLVKGDDPTTALDPGSGILISKIGKTYYAATNLHVVAVGVQNTGFAPMMEKCISFHIKTFIPLASRMKIPIGLRGLT